MTTQRFLFQRIMQEGIEERFMPGASQESRDWYRDQASKLRDIRPDRIMRNRNALSNSSRMFRPGEMYLFNYQARDKDKLPYYDRFPLIMLIDVYSSGFLGLNFHYLPVLKRAELMDSMYKLKNNNKFDETTRLKISYNIVKALPGDPLYKPCVKRYLNNYVKSRFVKIHPAEWDLVLMLPLDRFAGAQRQTVYKDSRKMYD